ncbi:MAG TPA: PVC-type heme-binding CxxCH protein, partial [Methylomirabilota bacterium]|nr:PVC-type heme-binding CxxCH protein [Methylomirabilota bacterium]
EIELVAGTNLVPRPIEADFDEQGRLYVTDSSGSNDKVEKQLAEKPHRVVRLEDTDGDGRFDKSITFADKMMLPQGCMWLDGSLYVAAPPSIWKLTDTNNDGVADVRVEWFQGKTLTGCANDLHGPYAGPDGWIYWCKGAFAKQTYTLPNGKEFTTRASHIFRARPDGTGVEPVMTGGMDNPVGLAFTPEGERILSGTFFQNPEGGKRDGLIHALYGGVYGKPNDALEGHPRTGDLMPIMTHLGPAAPAGLMRYESEVFGKEFQNNLFTACFNLHKITRHILEPLGATYKTRDSDFLVSDNTDFHPTDVLEDPDGSLIVVDTGGWYKLCCPTSQLEKPDVLGGIYRIRKLGGSKLEDPRGLKILWSTLPPDSLVALLDDARPAVRIRAVRRLGALKEAAIPALSQAVLNPTQALNAVWALTQIESPRAREAVRMASKSRMGVVRIAGLHSASAWRDPGAVTEAVAGLGSGSPHLARVASETLGRLGDKRAAPDLLAATQYRTDRALEHALTYALIETADPIGTAKALSSEDPVQQRIALIALDQMAGGQLKSMQVVPWLASTNALLKETAFWIISHRLEWGGEMARWIQEWFKEISSTSERPQFADILARSAGQAEVQQRIAEMAGQPASQATALSAMARSRLKEIPASWIEVVRAALQSNADAANQRRALAAANAFSSAKKNEAELNAALFAYARDMTHSKELRLNALAALPPSAIASDTSTFEFLRAGLSPANSVAERGAAASVLAKARLNESQLLALVESVQDAGPIEMPKLLAAFSRATNENIGLALLASLEQGKSFASLRAEMVKPHLTNFPATVQQKADTLLASLNTDAVQQKKHIDEMLASVKSGDIRRGQAIFNSPKAACSACHAIGYLGGKVGPDLTRIGQVRNERDLLEAVVYPDASFVRSYEPVIVSTKSGEEVSGVLRKDGDDEVVLATGPETEQRIARNDVADMRPGTVSVMPSGLAEQLTKEELADLLAFLKATRW